MKKYLFLIVLVSFGLNAKEVKCEFILETNQFTKGCLLGHSNSFIEIDDEDDYEEDSHPPIIEKTLPLPEKIAPVTKVSFEDILKNHVKTEDSIRFKGEESLKKEEVKSVEPEEENNETIVESYGYYTVQSGDVLSKIAQKFNLRTTDVVYFNTLLDASKLKIGQKLKMPFVQSIIETISSGKYPIENGDTLIGIANKFNLNPKEIVKFNHIRSTATLKVGKIIKMPFPHILAKIKAEKEAEAKKIKLLKLKKYNKKHYKKRKFIRFSGKHKLRVTATAYSSHRGQTDKTPFLAAWNNRLRPGMKIIAVSRDLLTRYGLKNGSQVRIGGLRGYYVVRDKMNKRFKKRIDIYMGINRKRALRWGRQRVTLYW